MKKLKKQKSTSKIKSKPAVRPKVVPKTENKKRPESQPEMHAPLNVLARKERSTAPLQPLGDRVLIKEEKPQTSAQMTASGIYIPQSSKEKETKKGIVVAVGEGRYDSGVLIPMNVQVGDVVVFGWGDTIAVAGAEYVVVRESEVIAIINQSSNTQ